MELDVAPQEMMKTKPESKREQMLDLHLLGDHKHDTNGFSLSCSLVPDACRKCCPLLLEVSCVVIGRWFRSHSGI